MIKLFTGDLVIDLEGVLWDLRSDFTGDVLISTFTGVGLISAFCGVGLIADFDGDLLIYVSALLI